jgi:hypothetical protein
MNLKWISIKELNERNDYSNHEDGVEKFESLMVATECGRLAYEWKRCIVIKDGVGIHMQYKDPRVWYVTGRNKGGGFSYTDEKPGGWDDTTD